MKSKKPKLLLLTSGGDSPGMNAAIRAIVRSGIYYGIEVYACHDGYQGLVNQDIFKMNADSVANCIQRGGTIIKTNRCKPFYHAETRKEVREFLASQGIGYMVVIGGDGSFRGASILEQEGGPKVIGIPGTIDNDIHGTEYTIGYDTARNTALQAIDKIRDTAMSSSMYFLVETMGRNAGFLAADVGLAGGAEFILTPEFPISVTELADQINEPKRNKKSLIIVVAEADDHGRSIGMAARLKHLTSFDYRVCILGHTQRGGSPTAMDRTTASYMGHLAVKSLLEGKSNSMVAMQNNDYVVTAFPDPKMSSRRLSNDDLLKLSTILSI